MSSTTTETMTPTGQVLTPFDRLSLPGWYECSGCPAWISHHNITREAVTTACLAKDCPTPHGVECSGCKRVYSPLYQRCPTLNCGKRLEPSKCKSCKYHWEWRVQCDKCDRRTTVGMLVPSRIRNCEPVMRVAYQTPFNPDA